MRHERSMNHYDFTLAGAGLAALGSGALWWPEEALLVASDLHLGKSERIARRGGPLLPPFETADTLARLAADIERTGARTVVCLGDSFDDGPAADDLAPAAARAILSLQAGRRWIWIAGNHDPAPLSLGGTHAGTLRHGPLTFRHIAQAGAASEVSGEVSGHFHPKARLAARGQAIVRPCFLVDEARVILPAYGTFTGGLHCHAAPLASLMAPRARAVLTGETPRAIPMPR